MENIPNNFRNNEAEKLNKIRKIDRTAAQIYLDNLKNSESYTQARHDKLEDLRSLEGTEEEMLEKELSNTEKQKELAQTGTREEIIEMLKQPETVDSACYENILALSLQDNDTELQMELFNKAKSDNHNPGTSFETGPMFFKYSTEEAVLAMLDTFILENEELLAFNQEILFDRGGEIRKKLLTKYSGQSIQSNKEAYRKVLEEATYK